MRTFEAENHAPSYLPDSEWTPVWSGESIDDAFIADRVK